MFTRVRLAVVALATTALIVFGVGAVSSDARRSPSSAGQTVLTVGRSTTTRAIPGAFVGLSMEYPAVEQYAGTDPAAVDPVFEQLIRNLAPGGHPLLRIGGDTTDWTWSPIAGVHRPPWVRFALTPSWLEVTRALATAVGARLIPSINLEADSRRIAAAEQHALLTGLGARSIVAFELGNEPELYGTFAWYRRADGRRVAARPRSYDFAAFAKDFANVAAGLGRAKLAGPSTGGPKWTRPIPGFVASEPQLGMVTVHRYGLDRCEASDPVPTIPGLMSAQAQRGVARSALGPTIAAHEHHIPLRIEELNAVSCGGQAGVSNTFAAALWALDTLFEAARVGVDGVNIHTRPQSLNSLFTVQDGAGGWQAQVSPEYYGLMLFAQAVPPGARLLRVAGAPGAGVHAWATRSPDGVTRVVLIDENSRGSRKVTIRVAGAHRDGRLERLDAPGLAATQGVSLDGQSFGTRTATGTLSGSPDSRTITPVRGRYSFRISGASAAMLVL